MSPGRTSQPPESGQARTPAAIDAPMPSPASPAEPTSGRTTTSRAATLLRATSTNAGVVTTTTRRWLAIAVASVASNTLELPSGCASLCPPPSKREPLPAARTITVGCAAMRRG